MTRVPSLSLRARTPLMIVALLTLGGASLAGCAAGGSPAPSPTPTQTPTVTPSPTPSPTATVAPADWTLHSDPAPDPHCAGTGAAEPVDGVVHIYVSIEDQHLWQCSGENLLLDAAVTTGASAVTNVNYATPTGTFTIQNKVRNTELVGHDANGSWDDAVSYWLPFNGGIGMHDASWQTFPFGSDEYREHGSHGCVHVPLDAIAQIYDTVTVGTPVTIE